MHWTIAFALLLVTALFAADNPIPNASFETHGDRITGSYTDKSENYPLDEFRRQFSAARACSGKYCWIYGHGTAWMSYTPEQVAHYKQASLSGFPEANWLLPTVPNIAEYYQVTAGRQIVKLPQ
jgi:hypothetical protein